MDLLNELARNIDPALLAQVQALIAQQQAKLAPQDTVLAENDFKIKALTFELAYYMRVGSVALANAEVQLAHG